MAAAYRGTIVRFAKAQSFAAEPPELIDDGLLIVEHGKVVALGPAVELLQKWPVQQPVQHFPGRLILPGLIDLHVHFPQLDVIAAYGSHLLEWLNRYTFPAE